MVESVDQQQGHEAQSQSSQSNASGAAVLIPFPQKQIKQVTFDRKELSLIFDVYGREVARGEWRDYAMDFGRDSARFLIFRRSSEQPLFQIVKTPALARKQGAYAVISQGGLVLKRGQELAQVIRVLIKKNGFSE
jgi:hypothetical protein